MDKKELDKMINASLIKINKRIDMKCHESSVILFNKIKSLKSSINSKITHVHFKTLIGERCGEVHEMNIGSTTMKFTEIL
jgi:hypothetical protein